MPVSILTSYCQYFSMNKLPFHLNKDTMLILAFHTSDLGFISCVFMHYGVEVERNPLRFLRICMNMALGFGNEEDDHVSS